MPSLERVFPSGGAAEKCQAPLNPAAGVDFPVGVEGLLCVIFFHHKRITRAFHFPDPFCACLGAWPISTTRAHTQGRGAEFLTFVVCVSQDTDAQNNVILEEAEDEDEAMTSPNATPVPVDVTVNTTFLHLHADIPFADDDVDDSDVINNEANQSNSNNKNGGSIALINQNNKNQSESSIIPAISSSLTSRTTSTIGSNQTDNTTTTTASSNNITESSNNAGETPVQVHKGHSEPVGSPNSNTSCLLANQHIDSAGNELQDELANERAREGTPVESLNFTESVYPLEQFDGDEIFVWFCSASDHFLFCFVFWCFFTQYIVNIY